MAIFQNHPFRFLLQFEWCLLAICAVGEVVQVPPFRAIRGVPHDPLVNLAILLMFGLLSLRLPPPKRIHRWAYVSMLLGLLTIAAFVTGLQFLPLLCIVLVLRCGVIVTPSVSWAITGFTFLMSASSQIYYLMTFQIPRLEQASMRRSARLGIPPELPGPDLMDPITSRILNASLSTILLLGLVLLFVQVLMATLVAERRNREALASANIRLREYALKAETNATLQERNRISREIHDALGHSLTASNLYLEAALRLLKSDPEEATDLLYEAKRLGSQTLQAVRDSVMMLRSEDPLKSQTLEQAIAQLLQSWSRSTQIVATCEISPDLPNLPESLKVATYRIIQEALTNISKYAQATTVDIQLKTQTNSYHAKSDRSSCSLQLTIQDNGIGFVLDQTRSGFGLQGMEERSIALGGLFSIETAPGDGCRICAVFPLTVEML